MYIYLFMQRERERREKEKERVFVKERDDHTTTMHLNFIHFFLLPLQKKIPRLQLLHTSTHQKQTNSMSAIQFSARAAVAPKISLRKSSKVSVRTGVRAQAVAARKW